MDYADLKGKILNLVGRAVPELAYQMATEHLSRELRIREMETAVSVTVTGGSFPLPELFEEVRSLRSPAGQAITATSPQIEADFTATGAALHFVVGSDSINVFPAPEDGTELALVYFRGLTPLSGPTDTNAAISGGALSAYVFAVLENHARLIRDDTAAAAWAGSAKSEIEKANKAATRSRYNGGTLRPRVKRTIA